MDRTIRVKGTGTITVKPDQTVISMTLKSIDANYDKSMKKAAEQLEQLKNAIAEIGFCKDELKTTDFNVAAEYSNERDRNGNFKKNFEGYACNHALTLKFDFDSKLLSKVIAAISGCIADPKLNIRFTVKDKDAIDESLLESAAQNAKKKAEILAKASGVTLGSLLSVSYKWSELNVFSNTNYGMEERCMALRTSADMSIEPEDISLSDSASFIWEIK